MVDSNVTYREHRLTILGKVNLILEDGFTLNAMHGIRMAANRPEGASLTIYAQSTGDNKGVLKADASQFDSEAGIGGGVDAHAGTIIINGGYIEAKGGIATLETYGCGRTFFDEEGTNEFSLLDTDEEELSILAYGHLEVWSIVKDATQREASVLKRECVLCSITETVTTPEANPVALAEMLLLADDAKEGITESNDGSDVVTSEKWAPASAFDAFEAAVTEAQNVKNNLDSTQEQLNNAEKELMDAVLEFLGEIKDGTKETDDPDPTVDPDPSNPVSIKNAKVVLSASAFAYNGKVRKPAIRKIGGKALKAGTDYTAKWSNKSSRNVGAYKVTITGKGNYTGVTKATYKINPKGTSLKKPKKGKKTITVKWKKQSAKMSKSRITGYQIQLATNKKFTRNKKTVTVKGYKKVSRKVTKLKGGKKYYVKIRTYKTIKGKKFYSKWSKVKTVKTKK